MPSPTRTARFAGFDAAVLMEVVEHVDPPRLEALERVVFGAAKPGAVIVTTPNSEYNVLYEGLDGLRHPDHRFEWDRARVRASGPTASPRRTATRSSDAASATVDEDVRHPDPDGDLHPEGLPVTDVSTEKPQVTVPAMGLVVLVGVSGSGKSTFARTHFKPTEVVSSDFCRGLVADDENDQSATPDAFDVLHYIVGTRLRRGLLTVVDATNVQHQARASLVKLARKHDVLADAIVLDVPESLATERNKQRPDRDFGPHVVSRQHRDLERSLRRLKQGGLPPGPRPSRRRPDRHRRDHPRAAVERPQGHPRPVRHHRRRPRLRLGASHAADRARLAAPVRRHAAVGAAAPRGKAGGLRWRPRRPRPRHPGRAAAGHGHGQGGRRAVRLRQPRGQAGARPEGRRRSPCPTAWPSHWPSSRLSPRLRQGSLGFMDGLISHYVLDDGKLVVAHAGLKESYHGRSSGRVRSFALYGDTTGETDEYGLPVRYPWAQEYRGRAMVVYGHTPVPRRSGSTTPSASTPAWSSAAT